ncbi:MAG: O-antigen ligase family protein, partial [Planctomycetota bacterium]
LMSSPGWILLALAAVFCITSTMAMPSAARVSQAASLMLLGYLLFIPTTLVVCGLRMSLWALMWGLVINVLCCWAVYGLVPELGVFEEDLGDGFFSYRMGGLGHPNAVGRCAALMSIVAAALILFDDSTLDNQRIVQNHVDEHGTITQRRIRRRRLTPARCVLIGITVLGVATMLNTMSRTAMLAGGASFVMMAAAWLGTRRGILISIATLASGVVGLLAIELTVGSNFLTQKMVSVATKTGSTEELLTATGRTDIWAETIRLIQQRPWTGYGLNSAPDLLWDYSQHAHNVLLHTILAGGVFAGFVTLALLLLTCLKLASASPLTRGICTYVLVSGLFEDTLLDTFPGPATLLWVTILLWPSISFSRYGSTRINEQTEGVLLRHSRYQNQSILDTIAV